MEISKKDRAEDDGGMIKVSPLYPNQDVLGVIGEFCFLCFHSTLHRKWSMEMIGRIFEPPIHLKQFKVYRARDVPRGLVTWAHMDAAAEAKFIKGNGLDTHEEWNSGKSLWVVDLIAPWGHGRAIIGDILKSLPGTSFKTLRVRGGKQNVVEYYRKDESRKWRTRTI
jgi:cytolysin-activating lysine-acyltransferase